MSLGLLILLTGFGLISVALAVTYVFDLDGFGLDAVPLTVVQSVTGYFGLVCVWVGAGVLWL